MNLREWLILLLVLIIVMMCYDKYGREHAPKDSYLEQTKHLRIIIEAKQREVDLFKEKARTSKAAADSIRAQRQKAKIIFYEKVDHTLHLNDSDTYELFMRNFSR